MHIGRSEWGKEGADWGFRVDLRLRIFVGDWRVDQLLSLPAGRHAERDPAVVVRFFCGRQVELRERNLLRTARSEVPQSLANDGVVVDLLLMLIAEYQNCGRKDRSPCRCAGSR